MKALRRLAPALLALACALTAGLLPSHADAQTSGRFAFADTTLLRDTLGLDFSRLFEAADSLQMLPDSLRAQMVRYRLPIVRLVTMADSMGVPVDSVGPAIRRESFNPLSFGATATPRTDFRYSSGYTFGKTNTTWSNNSDYSYARGPLFLRNGTEIILERNTNGGRLSLRQTRNSSSEAGWKVSPGVSLGGRATLSGYDSSDPNSTTNEGETKSDLQLSSRMRQQLRRDLQSELNVFAGYLDLKNFSLVKRGLSSDANGRLRFTRGDWLSHDLTGGMNGNLSRTRRPSSTNTLRTTDLSSTLRGALQVFAQEPIGLNVNYALRNTRVETPTEADTVNRLRTSTGTLDGTLRLRLDNNRSLSIAANLGRNELLTGSRRDRGVRADGRWVQGEWSLDADFSRTIGDSRFPRRNRAYGYSERQDNRNASAEISRPLGPRLIAKATGNIALSQFRSQAIADSASPPTPRDSYRQSYRLEALYNQSERFTSGVGLEVSLTRSINLPALSTSNNSDTRSYRADWRWNYRLLRGLTATQVNTVQADYQFYPFAPDRDGLSLDFNSVTNLNAVLTPRLTVELSHNARQQPRGDWRLVEDRYALLPSDENLNYTLRSRVTWTPSPALSLTLSPEYTASDRYGTSNGVEAPTRRSRRLSFTGGANLNMQLGRRGQLTGSVNRSFSADRSTNYRNGLPQASPLAEQDYWVGSLQLSWTL